jgi:hypothetical protein
MSARRRAPKRLVLRVDRVGAYPHVEWKHWLECKHFELRKRKAPAERIGCTACLNRTEDEVEVVPDLERVRLEYEAQVLKTFGNQPVFQKVGIEFGDVVVDVEDVNGQAQVKSIRMSLTVPKDFGEFLDVASE